MKTHAACAMAMALEFKFKVPGFGGKILLFRLQPVSMSLYIIHDDGKNENCDNHSCKHSMC